MIHIYNGDVVATLVRRSGVPGEQLVFRESLVTGPVVADAEWIERRARALSDAFGEPILRVRTDLLQQEQAIDAAREHDEIVLWFEHDLFCLVHLLYLLNRLGDAEMSLVWSPQPIANHDDREVYRMYEMRSPVTAAMRAAAREAWSDFTNSDASVLNRWRHAEHGGFPFLREGMRLHLTRFPSLRNGLGLIEEQALTAVAAGASLFAAIFDALNAETPRFAFGDSQVARMLQGLSTCRVPLLTMTGELPKALFAITPAGERVLRGDVDHLDLNPPDQWLGGVHLTTEDLWRYDGTQLIRAAIL